ncbi:MAG TPA: alanine racemase [Bauldia sp.]|nr:alanine racemase [Bauldia sp.]
MILADTAAGRLTIDLVALAENWQDLSARSGEAATGAVVKGDAYGIGIEPAARALAEAGCHTFFVALPDEGVRVRETVADAAIYVLGGLIPGAGKAYAAADLRPVLNSRPEIEEWAALRRAGVRTEAALHVDTGMNRLGLTLGELRKLTERRDFREALGLSLVMSHLACADTPDHAFNRKQLAAFRAVRTLIPDLPASLANSAGIFLGPEYHFDVVRPGIALYGARAVNGMPNPMRPVVTLEALVLQVREAKAGETVGYGGAETLRRPTRIAIVGAGYADGYQRRAGASDRRMGASGFLRGRTAPILGRVSMDLIALDVTDVPGAERGDWVELFGPNISIDDVADHADTIGYELLTSLGRRYTRSYVRGPV